MRKTSVTSSDCDPAPPTETLEKIRLCGNPARRQRDGETKRERTDIILPIVSMPTSFSNKSCREYSTHRKKKIGRHVQGLSDLDWHANRESSCAFIALGAFLDCGDLYIIVY